MNKGFHICFEGRVQGVGFRFTARYLANKHRVSGWVMNLPQGGVELLAEGEAADIDNFLDGLQSEFKGYIIDTKLKEVSFSGEYNDFQVKFY